MIQNPILPGFHPDPCICRKGDDYYLAVSTFEWFPGIPVYHSKDLKHWELLTHVLTDDEKVDLKKLPSAKGIWAPCLTYCEAEDMFYVVYGVMNSMNARYFDVDNYLICARDIEGPWSEPVYLHSAGFDASLLHDTDGRKWIVSLEWETREGYEKPGAICLAEYSPEKKAVIGYPERIWNGGTDRGCIEAPHLTKKDGRYYIMCAEGGTGYNHCVTMGRAENVWGPYEKDPENPIVTSAPGVSNERHDPDHLKPQYYNPDSVLQKSGHGSYVETPNGEVYLVHLTARPFVPELRCTLGRETAIQKMVWTEDGWLRMADGGRLAKMQVPESGLPKCEMFHPEIYQHSAGLILYYDNMNYINLRKYYSQTLGQSALSVICLENGEKTEFTDTRTPVGEGPVYLRLYVEQRKTWFEWSCDGTEFQKIGRVFDTSHFSDEYCRYGEFTGTMAGLTCADRMFHRHYADFDFFEYTESYS